MFRQRFIQYAFDIPYAIFYLHLICNGIIQYNCKIEKKSIIHRSRYHMKSFCPKADMCLLYSHFIVKNIILLLPTFLQYNKIWQTATKRLLSYVRWKCTTNDICVMYIFCEGNIRLQNLHFFSQENAVKYWSPYYNITFSCWNNQKLIYMVLFLKNAISHLSFKFAIREHFDVVRNAT